MIVGITHDESGKPIRTVAIIGKVGHGLPSDGKHPSRKLNYFIARLRDQETGEYVEDPTVLREFGPNPTEIQIVLLFNDIERNFWTTYKAINRESGRIICQGDGKTAVRVDIKTNERKTIECNPDKCGIYKVKRCKPYGRLIFNFPNHERVGAAWKYETTSRQGIRQIESGLQDIKAAVHRSLLRSGIAAEEGFLAGIPIWLVLKTYRKKYRKGDDDYGLTVVSVVHLELRMSDWDNDFRKFDKFIASLYVASPVDESNVEIEEIVPESTLVKELDAEYYNDSDDKEPEPVIVGSVAVPYDIYNKITMLPEKTQRGVLNRISEMTQEKFDKTRESIVQFLDEKLAQEDKPKQLEERP